MLEKTMENRISHYITQKRNSKYFLSNVSGCPRIAAFYATLIQPENKTLVALGLLYFWLLLYPKTRPYGETLQL